MHEHLPHFITFGVQGLNDEMYKMNCHMEELKEKLYRQNYEITYEEALRVNFNFYKQYCSTSYNVGNLLLMFL
jgi:hypothetical protein